MVNGEFYFDFAAIMFTAFVGAFVYLVLYLHKEGKREGFPIRHDGPVDQFDDGVGGLPPQKTYRLAHGMGERTVPGPMPEEYELKAEPTGPAPGSPLEPTGDPMVDGVGPAAYAIRPEHPDLTVDGRPRIVPLRVDSEHHVNSNDPDPRGQAVYGCDGEQGATVVDLWVDRAEPHFRYAELDAGGKRVLLPMTMARVKKDGSVQVKSIRSDQFQQVPGLANPDQVTLQEEDKIVAFYGGGTLYATPDRSEPWL